MVIAEAEIKEEQEGHTREYVTTERCGLINHRPEHAFNSVRGEVDMPYGNGCEYCDDCTACNKYPACRKHELSKCVDLDIKAGKPLKEIAETYGYKSMKRLRARARALGGNGV